MPRQVLALTIASLVLAGSGPARAEIQPQLAKGKGADWIFVYKFNTRAFPHCADNADRSCPFGGKPMTYRSGWGQQYVYATKDHPALQEGSECVGDSEKDPVGATFEQIYDGGLNFVVWNDQFYNDPKIAGCGTSCPSPWGHSKGVLAWDNDGSGLVLQVTTPSWPGAGNRHKARHDGNTLGCVGDNNVLVAQGFFALKLNRDDTLAVARALANSSVVTDPKNPQIVKNGGPDDIRRVVAGLGVKSRSQQMTRTVLSTGVTLLSKPSAINASPWHLVSSVLGGVDLRVATWWNKNDIPDTKAGKVPACWPTQGNWRAPGAVRNAQLGNWDGTPLGLLGIGSQMGNHAKIGVSTSGSKPYAIFGDLNQEGALAGACAAKQNGRGGLFFVVEDKKLHDGVEALISTQAPSH
jgi:hypothetical protein